MRILRSVALLLFCLLLTAIVLRWVSLERWRLHQERTARSLVQPTPTPKPPRPEVIGGKLDTTRLFSGITVDAAVEPTPGGAASVEREDPQSYTLQLRLRARIPAPNDSLEDLAKVNPELPRILPGLGIMVSPEAVSPFFHELYETKVKRLRTNLSRLDQLLSRHNFYDCQTVLNLQHPETKRRAVLIQAEMDVDADGSDADRVPQGSGVFPYFQPATSYRWPKKGSAPNPYLSMYEERIGKYEAEAALKSTGAERKRELTRATAEARSGIDTLKRYSFLIGATDPFIVVPGGFNSATGAKVGDYAVVVHDDRIFPALVGDVGPSDKAGEASLRIAKEISNAATPFNRPVSDLAATYIVFPGTADTPFGPPDLYKIHARCEELVKEIGGAGVPLHRWEDIIPTPTPTPTPTPSPTPSPSPTPTPATTASPDPSAAASVSPSSSPGASPAPTFAFPLPSVSPSVSPGATAGSSTPSPGASPKAKASPKPKRKKE